MSDELKPCPHCGSATAPGMSNCVELESCANFEECSCKPFSCVVCDVHKGGCGASGGFAAGEEKAVEKWNTRAERTCRIRYRAVAVSPGGMEGDEWYYCDACGYELDDDEHVAWDDYVFAEGPAPFDRCLDCGAKVVG